jgi:hypothetical protein
MDSEWISNKSIGQIREFVCGMFSGINMSGRTRMEVLGEEWHMNWNADIEVHVFYLKEDDRWDCRVYQCNDYSQFFGNESAHIDLGEEWQ